MTICPCCGFKFDGALSNGCDACGARPVGEPLPKPEHELPSYGRSLFLVVIGLLMVGAFLIQTIVALATKATVSFGFWAWIAAGQTAAWRLKLVAIPFTVLVLWGARKIYRSMLESPERFCGIRYAKAGYMVSASVPVVIVALIGMTIPERLNQRRLAIEAEHYAHGYAIDRALFEYQAKFGKGQNPVDLADLRQLPDPDGSIGRALDSLNIDPKDYSKVYRPSADVAAALPKLERRPTVIKASHVESAEPIADGLAFNRYSLQLPGPDKLYGTEDDLIVRDGMITKASDSPKTAIITSATTKATKP